MLCKLWQNVRCSFVAKADTGFHLSNDQTSHVHAKLRIIKANVSVGAGMLLVRLVGKVPSHHLRLFAYRRILGMKIGSGSTIYRSPYIRRPSAIEIGRNTIIGSDCVLDGRCGLRIGDNVAFSKSVWIWTLEHDVNSKDFAASGGPVEIGDRAWLSCRTTILPGVTIGEGAVICAGAVVTKDVEPYAIMAGVPARSIGERSRDIDYTLKHRIPFG